MAEKYESGGTLPTSLSWLRVDKGAIVNERGVAVHLRGTCLGGWMNMENFITGFPANEALMRSAVLAEIGVDRSEFFFNRLLHDFFSAADADFLASLGLNSIRVPINYHHFESDRRPFEVDERGFEHLDRLIALCGERGIYVIVDLHAVPGSQNYHWHSDNPTHVASFWTQRQFQDRVVHLWEVIADRYNGVSAVAGYNPLNEPADASRSLIGPFYERLVAAIRSVDSRHILFVDGNTYSTEFDIFGEPFENTVYTCHDYVAAGLGPGGEYPGTTKGTLYDRGTVEAKFLERTSYCRRTGTPIWVGEFGPIYTGDAVRDESRYRILTDQLDLYDEYDAGWAIWTYKDVGRQGIVHLAPGAAYEVRFRELMAKKDRLAVDFWGSEGVGVAEVTEPVQDLIAREFPDFDPYPWGRVEWVQTLLLNILCAQPLVGEYAALFRGLDEEALAALAGSFAFERCHVRERLATQLARHAKQTPQSDRPQAGREGAVASELS
ncbi:MAG: cellulase family glycosylhydrolase [Actinomycetota bacterium]|nr:cellulase family glycosylhydrolase [Actinomycetota bacterium]